MDYSLATLIVCSRCRSFTIVDVVFSLSVASGIHLVMGSDHLILLLSFRRNTVRGCLAIDKNSRPEKSIATPNRTNYDLL